MPDDGHEGAMSRIVNCPACTWSRVGGRVGCHASCHVDCAQLTVRSSLLNDGRYWLVHLPTIFTVGSFGDAPLSREAVASIAVLRVASDLWPPHCCGVLLPPVIASGSSDIGGSPQAPIYW